MFSLVIAAVALALSVVHAAPGAAPHRPAQVLDDMTLAQRVGQLFMVGTPADRVQALNKAINKATAGLARAGSFTALGILPVLETTDQFRQFVAADVARSAELLKEAGFKPE